MNINELAVNWMAWIKTENFNNNTRSINVLGETTIMKPQHYPKLMEKSHISSILSLELSFIHNDIQSSPPPYLMNYSKQLKSTDIIVSV